MTSQRPFLVLVCGLLLAGTLSFGPAAVMAPLAGAPQPMPPHPERLEQWIAEGKPLPPFMTDPAFFQGRGVNQPTHGPLQVTGSINALAIVVEFSDNVHTVTATSFDSLIFDPPVVGRGSVRDYYEEVSYGQVDIVTVDLPSSLGWQSAPQTYAWYVNGYYCWGSYPQNCQRLAEDIVDAVDAMVDFSSYDADGDGIMEPLMLVHSGQGAEFTGSLNDIWSHSWVLNSPRYYDGVTIDRYVIMPEFWQTVTPVSTDMTVGVFAHEMGHGFWGLPDLYDYDGSSYGTGDWSLMAGGAWNGPNSGGWGTDGSSPAWPEAWSRLQMGFDEAVHVLGPMSATFPPVETTPYAISRFKSGPLLWPEYFLVENRQQLPGTYDEYLPASGLFIWHVDDTLSGAYGPNSNECRTIPHCSGACSSTANHYLVALEQADGADHLEFHINQGDPGDPFPGTSGQTFWMSPVPTTTNPESGTWYDNGCAIDSCIDISNIACSSPPLCTASVERAVCPQDELDADLGDAPSSQNSQGITMTAYPAAGPFPWVGANFPTVYLPAPDAPGPRHASAQGDSWLGDAVSLERQADQLPDQDTVANISPTIDLADMDSSALFPGMDDGVLTPVPLAHCVDMGLPFTITVDTGRPVITRYVNIWFDWNRDGDWGDVLSCTGGLPATEWAVQDEPTALGPGAHSWMSMPFRTHITVAPDTPFESWMRINIAESQAPWVPQPVPNPPLPPDGRGPLAGYNYGETEDYHLFLDPWLAKSVDLPAYPAPGMTFTYRIEFTGLGNVIAAGAVISDVLPPGVEYLDSRPPAFYDPASRTVVWPANVQPGVLDVFELDVEVTGQPGDTITNTASLLWAHTLWKQDTYSFTVAQTCTLLTGVEITGPVSLEPGVAGTYLATVEPPTATNPAFLWSNGVTETSAVYSWTVPGTYTVVVTATNCQNVVVSDTFSVLVGAECISLTGVTVGGPAALPAGVEGTYLATVEPPTATNPAFLWSNGVTETSAVYSWTVPGTYTVVVTATNCQVVQFSDSQEVVVTAAAEYRIYLPLVLRNASTR